jgi:hypothetical protein
MTKKELLQKNHMSVLVLAVESFTAVGEGRQEGICKTEGRELPVIRNTSQRIIPVTH